MVAGSTCRRWWPAVVMGCVLLAGCSGTAPSGVLEPAAVGRSGAGPSAAAAPGAG